MNLTSIPRISADERGLKHRDLTEKLIRIFFDIYNELGHGFLDSVIRATDIEVGILFNFGAKPEFRRFVFENERQIRVHPRSSAEKEVGF